ncbi:MAG: nicotinate-nucleotide--dimethylbenzimidazole phosphoribosyltransferase [Actinobacteria bacterium]|nr:nicotinate-nucleotide--dimethylbenzimidazole phosphoribosyltransferase [Actinomycetota bacterium]
MGRFDGSFGRCAAALEPADPGAAAKASELQDKLTKPRGALGALEPIGARLAAMAGSSPPPLPDRAAVAIFAGDHGVISEGVTPWPAEVTAQMVANFCAGGAAINVLARQVGAEVLVVDVGVASPLESSPRLVQARVRDGTANIAQGPAMSTSEATSALDVGAGVACLLVSQGFNCLITGDMGIGNTTPSAALISILTGTAPSEVTGRGTGIDDSMLAHKVDVISRALARFERLGGGRSPLEILAGLGGLEIAALAGFVVGGAAQRVPVLIDGVISCAATLVAKALCPGCIDYCIAGHRSSEPGASVALKALGLDPLLDLGLRLGEGTGACLCLPIVQSAARVLAEMATFDSAGVAQKS